MKQLLTGVGIGFVFLTAWFFLLSSNGYNNDVSADGAQVQATDRAVETAGLPQQVRPMDLSGPFTFAGESIPMENFDVRERLDAELMRNAYFHRSTLLLLKRMPRYFPTIERILAEEGVPDDLKYLAVAESGLSDATSVAGAKGVWQFMAPTGRAYGLEIGSEVDERFHLEKATRAACRYLKEYHERFGSWSKVAAAYNMGGPNLDKWMDRQRAETVYDLDINDETMAYLFRIVALKTILLAPEEFGYEVAPDQTYPPLDSFRTVTVDRSLPNLGDFAREQGTTYRMLKVYNPWLVAGSLTVSGGETYTVRVP